MFSHRSQVLIVAPIVDRVEYILSALKLVFIFLLELGPSLVRIDRARNVRITNLI